jgi:DNA invertase Pin-like site-specific DNA recombinase
VRAGRSESLEFYVDAGKSAKDQNRPQLQRLKQDIAAGKIDLVICFKLDRITRSLKDFVDLWALFAEHEVNVISLREKLDTSMPTGEAMVQLIMVFAQLERKMTAERTFSIMRDRADRGLWNGGHVLGYWSRPDDPGKLEIDGEGAAIVRRIVDLFEELGSAGAVTRRLNELRIRYPTFRTRSDKVRGGKLFVKQEVTGILRNAVYLGQIRWGESIIEDCHEPIITRQQFDRVQLLVGKIVDMVRVIPSDRQPVNFLAGLQPCGQLLDQSAEGRVHRHGRSGVNLLDHNPRSLVDIGTDQGPKSSQRPHMAGIDRPLAHPQDAGDFACRQFFQVPHDQHLAIGISQCRQGRAHLRLHLLPLQPAARTGLAGEEAVGQFHCRAARQVHASLFARHAAAAGLNVTAVQNREPVQGRVDEARDKTAMA